MRYKRAKKITHRVSSVTNGFVQAILPDDLPNEQDHKPVLKILGIDPENLSCAYCGDGCQHWDHLNPFVSNKRPSGYLNEARNLVPACGLCNTSKSGRNWRDWLFGNAKGSPSSRGIIDLEFRAERLQALEREMELTPIDLRRLVTSEIWDRYWQRRDEIERLIFEAQRDADVIRAQIRSALKVKFKRG